MVPRIAMLALVAACSGDEDGLERVLRSNADVLLSGVDAAAPAPGAAVVAVVDGAWLLHDPESVSPVELGEADTLQGSAQLDDGTVLLAANGGLIAWADGQVMASDLALAVPGHLVELQGRDGVIWLRTTTGLHRWTDGRVEALTVDGLPALGPFAPGGVVDGERVVWLSGEFGLAAVSVGTLEVLARRPGAVHDVAADAQGQAWAVLGDGLWTWGSAGWEMVRVPASEVAASPDRDGCWASAGGTVWWLDDEATAVEGPALVGLNATSLGVMGMDGADLVRVSTAHEAVVLGPADAAVLDAPAHVVVLPTDIAAAPAVRVTLDGIELPTEPLGVLPGWRATVDPALFAGADAALAVQVVWPDDTVDVPPWTVAGALLGPVTWDDQVGPLYGDRCAHCHDNGTETILSTPDAWQARIGDILIEVDEGRMPLGGPQLTASEIALIRAWADGGFP
ncbi:MAG: hypothetical protein ACI8PZ_000373 [Myxococcota bacterium]|jgi:hypothetical protein